MKKLLAAVLTFLLCFTCLSGCNGGGEEDNGGGDTPPEYISSDEKDGIMTANGYKAVFKDPKFEQGFRVSSTDEANHTDQGRLDYGGEATGGNAFWRLAQWSCFNNDILKASYSKDGDTHIYATKSIGGVVQNKVAVNTKTGQVALKIDTASEYGKTQPAGTPAKYAMSHPRQNGQPWPTLLVDCSFDPTPEYFVSVSEQKEIIMSADFTLTQADKMNGNWQEDPSRHSAQFQWFIIAQNRRPGGKTPDNPDYGRYIWFGLSYYDHRSDFPPLYASQDGGKENNTGQFIYIPDMREILGGKKVKTGERRVIDTDILPIIRTAFDTAQSRRFLTETLWEDLYITSMNIGFEVTGTYNCAADIFRSQIYYR